MKFNELTIYLDVDGTLVDTRCIRGRLASGEKFNHVSETHAVPPITPVVEWVRKAANRGAEIVVLTYRSETVLNETKALLARLQIKPDRMLMRSAGDTRIDTAVKRDLRNTHAPRKYELAIDDNPFVVDMWEQLGVPAVLVPGWDWGYDGPINVSFNDVETLWT